MDAILPDSEITGLLQQWRSGHREAFDRLIPLVYQELRLIASRRLAGDRRHPLLQTTALVNEAYLRLLDQHRVNWQSRAHFFAIAAQLMRRVIVDEARRRLAWKRGRGGISVSIEDVAAPSAAVDTADVLALDAAVTQLAKLDPDYGKLVELRFFAGLTLDETAAVLGVSKATVKRDWIVAKGWLYQALTRGASDTDPRS